jgi:oligo-1,6-glucosidase
VLVYGAYEPIDRSNPKVYAYTRSLDNNKVIVLLNFSPSTTTFSAPASVGKPGAVLINNVRALHVTLGGENNRFKLEPYQAVIVTLQ